MRASLQTLVILGTAVLTGCTVTMAPPGQNTAANPAMTPQTTVVETKAIPVVERRSAIRATVHGTKNRCLTAWLHPNVRR